MCVCGGRGGGGGADLYVVSVAGARPCHVAFLCIPSYHAAEAAGGVPDASRQDLVVQEGVDDAALAVAGPPEEGHLHVVSPQDLLDPPHLLLERLHPLALALLPALLEQLPAVHQPLLDQLKGLGDAFLGSGEPLEGRSDFSVLHAAPLVQCHGAVQLRWRRVAWRLHQRRLLPEPSPRPAASTAAGAHGGSSKTWRVFNIIIYGSKVVDKINNLRINRSKYRFHSAFGDMAAKISLPPDKVDQLVKACMKAKDAAYAPYSNFPVGAALMSTDGRIFTGALI